MARQEAPLGQFSMGEVVERAYGRFKAIRSLVGPKGDEAYFPHHAVNDTIEGTGLDPFELVKQLIEQTTLTPDEIDWDDLDLKSAISFHGWQGLKNICKGIAEQILLLEMYRRYPDVIDISNRREELFPG